MIYSAPTYRFCLISYYIPLADTNLTLICQLKLFNLILCYLLFLLSDYSNADQIRTQTNYGLRKY